MLKKPKKNRFFQISEILFISVRISLTGTWNCRPFEPKLPADHICSAFRSALCPTFFHFQRITLPSPADDQQTNRVYISQHRCLTGLKATGQSLAARASSLKHLRQSNHPASHSRPSRKRSDPLLNCIEPKVIAFLRSSLQRM